MEKNAILEQKNEILNKLAVESQGTGTFSIELFEACKGICFSVFYKSWVKIDRDDYIWYTTECLLDALKSFNVERGNFGTHLHYITSNHMYMYHRWYAETLKQSNYEHLQFTVVSADEELVAGGGTTFMDTIVDENTDPLSVLETTQTMAIIRAKVSKLRHKDALEIYDMVFIKGITQEQVGLHIGKTKEAVRQVCVRIKELLATESTKKLLM